MVMVKLENLSKGYLVTLCFLIFIDYLSKIIALNYIEVLQQNDFLPLIDFLIVFNSGIAFSFLDLNNFVSRYILLTNCFFITLYFFKIFLDEKDNLKKKALLLIVSGALGNFIDRLPDGIVTDFLHFKPFDFSLIHFNFADAYITIGAIIFICSELILLKSKNESKN
jgi:signal peptidase II